MVTQIRLEAVRALHDINHKGAYANIIVQQYISTKDFSDLDRRFFTELVYGVLRRKNYLDAMIEHFTNRKIKKLSPWVADILRLGLYQLIYMNRVPAQAAVNESVLLAQTLARGLKPLVNGVLRNYLRRTEEVSVEALSHTKLEEVSYTYNQPLWLIKLWATNLPVEEVERMCAYFNDTPRLTGRFNLLKGTKESIVKALEQDGIAWKPSDLFDEGITVVGHEGDLKSIPSIANGLVTFLDEGSLAIAHVLDVQPGDRVLDCCAAPGSKTFHMATLMKNEGYIKACDIHEHKIELLKEGAKRLGVTIVDAVLQDSAVPNIEDSKTYDKVLVDAPCSGWGILQKKLDMRWRKTKDDVEKLPYIQLSLLETASKSVANNGILVYSTCTLNKMENEDVIEAFLQNNPDFTLTDARPYIPFSATGPMLTLWPQHTHTDGFFIARLQREAT